MFSFSGFQTIPELHSNFVGIPLELHSKSVSSCLKKKKIEVSTHNSVRCLCACTHGSGWCVKVSSWLLRVGSLPSCGTQGKELRSDLQSKHHWPRPLFWGLNLYSAHPHKPWSFTKTMQFSFKTEKGASEVLSRSRHLPSNPMIWVQPLGPMWKNKRTGSQTKQNKTKQHLHNILKMQSRSHFTHRAM